MPSLTRGSDRIVIAGASSLLGVELKSLLEESRFAGADFRLVDEEVAAGTLTEAGGEPAVIQPAEEGSFERANVVFFSGSPGFTLTNLSAARKSGARIIDLSGAAVSKPDAEPWFPKLDVLLARKFPSDRNLFAIPSAAATMAASLKLGLTKLNLDVSRMGFTGFQPVSEAGRPGIEELESQTGQLLSLRGVGQPVFDAQVAFNLLDRYGPKSKQSLQAARDRLCAEVEACLGAHAVVPALRLFHAPVFYGAAFSAYVELSPDAKLEQLVRASEDAGFVVADDENKPSNVSVAGEKVAHVSKPEPNSAQPGGWWFWGAADNIRLPAANAVKLAEMLA